MNPLLSLISSPYSRPSLEQWLGSDALGQSFLPMLLKATIFTLFDVGAAASLALFIGLVLASLGSVFPRTIGPFLFNLASTFSFSTPLIAVLLLLYSIWGDHPLVFPLAVGGLLWGTSALTLQTALAQQSRSEYVRTFQGFGMGKLRVIVIHVIPNLYGPLRAAWLANWPIMLSASVITAYLGVKAGAPTLGSLLKSGYELFPACWWLWLPPTMVTCATFLVLFVLIQLPLRRRVRV